MGRYFLALLWSFILLGMIVGCSGTSERVLTAYLHSNEDSLYKPASVDNRPVRFVIEPGAPARAIGQQLLEAGLIRDDLLFEAYVRVNGLSARLAAGTFVLSPSMSMVEIVETLQHAEAESITITIPEGWRLEQTAEYLDAAGLFDTQSDEATVYRRMAESGDLTGLGLDAAEFEFLSARPAGTGLEGYLFPDTYEIPAEDTSAADVLRRQLRVFAAKVTPEYEQALASNATMLDLFAVLTVASIVEREAVIADERPSIAAVYLNRIANGMRLEADPTVQYAMGYQPESGQWWKTPVFLEEYSNVDSPYNTYLYSGLPPGPIASPGLSSIRAVLYPDDHDYLYFVAVPDGSGAHVFAETFEEHTENVRRYQQGG